MYDETEEPVERHHGIHLPSLADPMSLLDELERRLDHCETVVAGHLEQIQRRLDALEADVKSIRADIGGGRVAVEQELVSLAERVTRLEESGD
tara:strand:- start:1722 stop:2000 length:279 start_codon:yes stop_codon:yes gene_type:complete